ncbi:hypothetical protein KC365_g76 [Hortaea werneckii]|nr:hypothetical protein KC365_g76 [Hortaea werneckii]
MLPRLFSTVTAARLTTIQSIQDVVAITGSCFPRRAAGKMKSCKEPSGRNKYATRSNVLESGTDSSRGMQPRIPSRPSPRLDSRALWAAIDSFSVLLRDLAVDPLPSIVQLEGRGRIEKHDLDYGEDGIGSLMDPFQRGIELRHVFLHAGKVVFAKERGVTRRTSSFRSSDLQAEVASDLLARRTAARYNVWRLGSIEHAGVVWTQHRLEEIQIILTQIAHGRANGQNQWRLDTHQRAVLELRFTVELRPPDLSCIVALISQSYYDVSIFLGRMRNDVRIVADMVVEVDAKPCSIACW